MQRMSVVSYLNAASNGDLAAVQQYIKENENDAAAINVTNDNGQTALMLAAKNGHNELAATLCEVPGIVVNIPLMFAALFRHLNTPQVAKTVISFEAFINAIKKDNLSVVQQYIRENKNNSKAMNAFNQEGFTALMEAVFKKRFNMIAELVAVPCVDVFALYRGRCVLEFTNKYVIEVLLYPAVLRFLINAKNDEVTEYMLDILIPPFLFDEIIKLSKNDAFALLKQIVEEREKNALGKVFYRVKNSYSDGVMAKVIAKYEELYGEFNVPSVTPMSMKPISIEDFIEAIINNNLSIVNQYIEENKNDPKAMNANGPYGNTPICEAVYRGKRIILDYLLAVPSINVFAPHSKAIFTHFTTEHGIKDSLYTYVVKFLKNAKSEEVTPAIIEILKHKKQDLFDVIITFKKEDMFTHLKHIVEEKEVSGLGKVFYHGKKTINKGVMAQVIAKYEELCKEFNQPLVILKQEFSLGSFFGGVFGANKKAEPTKANLILDSDSDDENNNESSHSL